MCKIILRGGRGEKKKGKTKTKGRERADEEANRFSKDRATPLHPPATLFDELFATNPSTPPLSPSNGS